MSVSEKLGNKENPKGMHESPWEEEVDEMLWVTWGFQGVQERGWEDWNMRDKYGRVGRVMKEIS